jgi:hypothetical protein
MAAGVLTLAATDGLWAIWAAFALAGVTQGGAVAVLGGLWPEFYGTRNIGAIRGFAVAAMVFATALGPGITGALLDVGVGLEAQFAAMGALQTGICLGFAALAGAASREAAAQDAASGAANQRASTPR